MHPSFDNRHFMIFNVSELGDVNFNQTLETSAETVRLNLSGSQTFVKWEGETVPSSIDALTTKEGPYAYEQILNILTGSAWTSDEPI
tara:strand:- start:1118 stop:1378 length:261 start_codon:yes stop_codon:yes gene_type:complete